MANWEVGPTKDVIQALMETLLDPRLPSRASVDHPPSEDAQKAVAKQIRAVVLLYNYYHRKQKPELEFLDFEPFSKLALSLRPSLTPFMKTSKESESMELTDQLSLTEKAIKDACDIALSLNASKDIPSIEDFLISKVAVLLIDSKKENCWLQFGAITEGVWALLEKEINISQEISREENGFKKRKTDNQADYSKRLQLGFEAVKDATGIDSSDLVVWETRVMYSMTKEKSAAQFYLMQCSTSLDINQSVPLSFLVENLQGPLAERFCNGWMTTTLVEYHHMLPYVGFIADWLSRKDLCVPFLNGYNHARSTENNSEEQRPQSNVPSLSRIKYLGEDLDHVDTNGSYTNGAAYENGEDHQWKSKRSTCAKTANEDQSNDNFLKELKNIFATANEDQNTKKNDNFLKELKNTCDKTANEDQSTKKNDNFLKELMNICAKTANEDQSTRKNDNCLKELKNICDKLNSTTKKGPSRTNGSENHKRDSLFGPSRMNMNGFSRSPVTSEERRKLNSKRKINQRGENIDARGPKKGFKLKMNYLGSNDSPWRDENITAENGDMTISCNQRTENTRVNYEVLYNIEVGNTVASRDLQNALTLLDGKRRELYSQICTMEDTLALYQHNIERIRDGGEVGLARECIKCIISGDDHLLPNEDRSDSQSKNQKRFSGIFLLGKSSCQDLEYICLKNKWRLPRYLVQPSHGKFVSNVVVLSKGFNLSSEGGLESNPSEARESAASRMITKIHNIFDQS